MHTEAVYWKKWERTYGTTSDFKFKYYFNLKKKCMIIFKVFFFKNIYFFYFYCSCLIKIGAWHPWITTWYPSVILELLRYSLFSILLCVKILVILYLNIYNKYIYIPVLVLVILVVKLSKY